MNLNEIKTTSSINTLLRYRKQYKDLPLDIVNYYKINYGWTFEELFTYLELNNENSNYEIDHIIPRSFFPTYGFFQNQIVHSLINLQILSQENNRIKFDKIIPKAIIVGMLFQNCLNVDILDKVISRYYQGTTFNDTNEIKPEVDTAISFGQVAIKLYNEGKIEKVRDIISNCPPHPNIKQTDLVDKS